MALVPTFMDVTYRDDANTTRVIRYRLKESANNDGSNMDDVFAAAVALESALAALTGDHIDYYDIVARGGGATHAADDASSNQLTAFVRTTLSNNDAGEFQVPAWRFSTYDVDQQLMLDQTFLDNAGIAMNLIKDIDSGLDMTDVEWAQSRTRKLRGKRVG